MLDEIQNPANLYLWTVYTVPLDEEDGENSKNKTGHLLCVMSVGVQDSRTCIQTEKKNLCTKENNPLDINILLHIHTLTNIILCYYVSA